MISAVILAKNEKENIRRCIGSVSFCDEIVVIDDFSTDGTVEKISNFKSQISNAQSKIKIFKRHLNGDFAAQRNFGLSKASGDWVLFIDADEVVSDALAEGIVAGINLPAGEAGSLESSGFMFKRRDIIFGKELMHGDIGNFREIRLAKKSAGKWKRKVHEFWDVSGSVGELKNPLTHFPHPTLAEFISHIDFYSTLHAQQKFEDGERSDLLKIILWPKVKFIHNYIWKLGFLDGTAGLVMAIMMSFHSFLAWSKLWLMSHEPLRK